MASTSPKMASMAAASSAVNRRRRSRSVSSSGVFIVLRSPSVFLLAHFVPVRSFYHIGGGPCKMAHPPRRRGMRPPAILTPSSFPFLLKTPRKTIGFSLPFGLILSQLLCYDKG